MLSLSNAQVYFLMNIHYGPKSIVTLSLSSLSLNSGAQSLTVTLTLPLHSALQLCTHLIAKYCTRSFFTTLHTSYCKHCTRSYFHNFEHILLQNIAQDIVYNFAHMLSQNIVKEISPAMETLVYKINFRIYHRNFAQHKVLCT